MPRSPALKAAQQRYAASDKGKAARARYAASDKGKAAAANASAAHYERKTPEERRADYERRRHAAQMAFCRGRNATLAKAWAEEAIKRSNAGDTAGASDAARRAEAYAEAFEQGLSGPVFDDPPIPAHKPKRGDSLARRMRE